jgi:hypothetical protein
MNLLNYGSQIYKFWIFAVDFRIANSQVSNMWKVDTRPTGASDFFLSSEINSFHTSFVESKNRSYTNQKI